MGKGYRNLPTKLGPRTEQNPSVELAAMARALEHLPRRKHHSNTLLTRDKAAVLTLSNPRQQSGQEHLRSIYESINKLKRKCNVITAVWLSTGENEELWTCAKEKAKEATRQVPQKPLPRARSMTLNVARAERGPTRSLPEKVGKLCKRVDIALPGKHTRKLYDQLTAKEASVLAQDKDGNSEIELETIPYSSCTISSVGLW